MFHEIKLKLSIGSDHAGYDTKKYLQTNLQEKYEIIDRGTYDSASVDYPDYAHKVALDVSSKEVHFGILICGSGQGVNICANKHHQIRAAVCWNEEISKLSRQHNDANVLSLPARFISQEEALKIVETFVSTNFEGGRHKTRVEKITAIFQQNNLN